MAVTVYKMNLPFPEADAATAAEVRDWLDRFAACVRDVDYAAARPFWHPDVVIFGTYHDPDHPPRRFGVEGSSRRGYWAHILGPLNPRV